MEKLQAETKFRILQRAAQTDVYLSDAIRQVNVEEPQVQPPWIDSTDFIFKIVRHAIFSSWQDLKETELSQQADNIMSALGTYKRQGIYTVDILPSKELQAEAARFAVNINPPVRHGVDNFK